MRIASSQRGDEFEINVISLIDVMLTLLMFFVVTASFEQKAMLKVALPEASATPTGKEERALVVLIDKDSHYFIGANEVLNPSVETLKTAIEQAAGPDRDQLVTLRADGRTPQQAVVTAMDALGQLGFTHLAIATTPAPAGKR